MFKPAEKTELNQISLTGIRALILIGLLIVQPRSLEEIKQTLIDLKIIGKKHSNDIIRIDLNTIKLMGCEISRSSAKTNYKYILTKHPFCLKFTEDEVLALKKVYNQVKKKANIYTLINYHEIFEKIAPHISDEKIKEILLGISVFKYYNFDEIKNLMIDCRINRVLDLLYKKQNSSNSYRKQIVAQKLVYNNDKIYLYGYDLEKNKPTVLNLRRVEEIIARRFEKKKCNINETEVQFLIRNIKPEELEDVEKIIGKTPEGYLVQAYYHNDFIATQRILSFGSKCVVKEPLEFRKNIIEKIKEMRNVYEC